MARAILLRLFAAVLAAALLAAALTTGFIAWHDWLALHLLAWQAMALTALALAAVGGIGLVMACRRPPSPVDRVRRDVAADPWASLAVAFTAGLMSSESATLANVVRRMAAGR